MSYINIIGWIASVLTAIIGLPLVINTFLAKKPPKVSLFSWWIYYLGILGFAFFGLVINDLPIVITQIFCGLTTFIFLVQNYIFRLKTTKKLHSNIAFLALSSIVYFLILLTGILFATKLISFSKIISAATYIVIFAGFCVNIAFLPQTLLGIKQKTIKFIPLTFLINLLLLNFAWVIYDFLRLVVEKESSYIPALIFQIIGFLIASLQLFAYFYQLGQQRKINKTFKINWI
ncbi:hypothetical protein [Mesomycoplasma dispar]|uniref:PQ-loop repeat-containing protein n=1 Tax=Mesomycoplasma dispar TaxID=86660 RepID=A0ABN5DRS0_9BACT|nr:hypothetical protein [Mesomycoplasma dispar]ATP59801.1 hypothetical protein CSW10_02590 [Mesomycoplasma dispar]